MQTCLTEIFRNLCLYGLKFYLQSNLGPSCCVTKCIGRKFQAWQEPLTQPCMERPKELDTLSYEHRVAGSEGGPSSQVLGLTVVEINREAKAPHDLESQKGARRRAPASVTSLPPAVGCLQDSE